MAIAVGGFTLTLTLAGSNGAREYANRLVSSNFDPSELLVGRDAEVANDGAPSSKPQEYDESIASISGGGPGSSFQFKRLSRADVDKIKSYSFVEQVRENYQITVQYVTREGQKKYTAGAEAYNPAQKPEVENGTLPTSGDIATGEVLLPEAYLEPLGFTSPEDALGREISITVRKPFTREFASQVLSATGATADPTAALAQAVQTSADADTSTRMLKIVGVTKKSATSFSFGVSPLLISSTDAKEMYEFTAKGTPDYDKFLYVYARIKDGTSQANISEAEQVLTADGFYTQSVKDIQKSLLQIVNTLQIVVMVFGFITLIASVFGIVNTQYISVLERTREIGLMKALGMRKKDISRLFILEAVWIGFLGGTLGSITALILGILINPWLSDVIGFDKGTYILVFQPLQIILLVVMLMFIAMVAGLLPARKAAKLDPIEALRTE
jgi:putative ABC transport system permease protein